MHTAIESRIRATGSRTPALYRTPAEAMPQILYGIDGGAPVSATDAYVIGPVTEVEPGKSFRWTEVKNTAITHEVELNAGGAQITTVHVTIRIERSIVAPPMDALS